MNEKGTLRIALDATPLSAHTGGVRRYVVELVQALAREFPEDEYHLLTDQTCVLCPDEWLDLPNVLTNWSQSKPITEKWWSIGLTLELARRQIEVFHGTDFAIPYLPRQPSVLTLHDLAPWKSASLQPPNSSRVRRRTPPLVHMATRLITPSNAVRNEAADFFALPKSKIRTTHLAPSTSLRTLANSTDALEKRFRLKSPYLLYVGSAEPRKNINRLMEAWRIARAEVSDLSLVLVGRDHTWRKSVLKEQGLYLPGYLEDKEIAQLLSQASAFVYPSLYEGFGLPVLEAMQAGVPVITSNDAAVTEVTAGAALQADGTSEREISAAVLSVLRDPFLRRQLREKGGQRACKFSWRSTATLTRAVYADAIRSF